METIWKTPIRCQFGAAIEILENAMRDCRVELWSDSSNQPGWISKEGKGLP